MADGSDRGADRPSAVVAGPRERTRYPRRVGTLDVRSRRAITVVIGVVLVWSVASLTLPRPDAGSFTGDPFGARIVPKTTLAAIASDRPTTSLDARRSEYLDVIPAVVSTEAGTRSALLWEIGDGRVLASSIATSPLATGLVRRGPPFSFAL